MIYLRFVKQLNLTVKRLIVVNIMEIVPKVK